MEIERYVAFKWAENVSKVKWWGVLTPYEFRKVDKTQAALAWGVIDVKSNPCFVVAIQPGVGINSVKVAVFLLISLFDARVFTSRMLALLAFMHYYRSGH